MPQAPLIRDGKKKKTRTVLRQSVIDTYYPNEKKTAKQLFRYFGSAERKRK
jgi:hypothetical protein